MQCNLDCLTIVWPPGICNSKHSQPQHHPQDGPWAWLVLFVAWLSNLVIGGISFSCAIVLPSLRDYFQKTRQQSAWIASIALSMMMCMGPLTGLLINRFGCGVAAMFGAVLCVSGLIMTSFAQHLEFMFFSYGIVFGCGSSFVVLTAFVVVTKFFTKWRSLAVGIAAGGLGSGNLVLSPVVEVLLSMFGWQNVFRILAGITTVVIFASCVYGPKEAGRNDANETDKCIAENEPKRRIFDCSVWTNYQWVLLTLVVGLAYFAKSIGQVSLAQHAKDVGVPEADFAKLYLYMGLTGTFARPGGGLLCQIKKIKALFVLQMAVVILGIIFLLLPVLSSYTLMTVFVLLFGAAEGVLVTSTNICVLNCFSNPIKKTSGYGIFMLFMSIVYIGGPPLSGHMADVYGTFHPSFYMAGSCCMLSAVIICFIHCLKKTPDQQVAECEPVNKNSDTSEQIIVRESTV